MKLREPLAASEESKVDVDRRILEFKHNMDTTDKSATKVDEAGAKLRGSEEYVRFQEDEMFKQGNQLLEKNAS